MKKRNPLAVVALSIITCGIYDLYWLVSTKKVLNEKTQSHTPTIWLLIFPIPLIIIGYALLIVDGLKTTTTAYNTSSSFGTTTQSAHPGLVLASFGLIFIGFILSFFLSGLWFYKYSKAVNEYTHGKMSTAVSFLVLWLIHLIGVALIQDAFNDVEVGDAAGMGTTGQMPQNVVGTSPVTPTYPPGVINQTQAESSVIQATPAQQVISQTPPDLSGQVISPQQSVVSPATSPTTQPVVVPSQSPFTQDTADNTPPAPLPPLS
jgi:hypothetical protein